MFSKKKWKFLIILFCMVFNLCFSEGIVKAEEGDYLLRVNLAANRINVFEKSETGAYDKEAKTMYCSSYANAITNEINYTIIGKNEWQKMQDETFMKYALQLDENLFIGTSPYTSQSNDSLIKDLYNGIGESKTAANIWLNHEDAKWLYENCKAGATVIFYNDETNPGSTGTPFNIKLSETAAYPGWDPTNDAEDNPWKGCSAKIEGVKDLSTKAGIEINPLDGIKGYDLCGNDISNNILLMGSYDIKTMGQYDITYYLKDSMGTETSVSAVLTVERGEIIPDETQSTEIPSESVSNNKDVIKEKTKGEKLKNIVLLGLFALAGTFFIIKYVQNKEQP